MSNTVSFIVAADTASAEQHTFDQIAALPEVVTVQQTAPGSNDLTLRRLGIATLTEAADAATTAATIAALEGVDSAAPSADRHLL